ncbi:MAG TPA: polysaccharide biosynthesis C-terminal domain-containing protein [Flavobacterium sp.]|jgi:O-antigen/teichoic acid export membrane protein|nr:polysaccharide biosynthesis C-terminal domain-containing protein [Flavobacterium sp.]
MGIVINQSIRNTIITYIGFAIGAANALFMYTNFLGKTYYGLTAFLLSSANILMPLMAFGIHNTLVKFFPTYKTEEQKSQFLTFMLLLPLLLVVPIVVIGFVFYQKLAATLSAENPIIKDYVWMIPVIGLCMGYFEIFYAWAKVHMLSVFGTFVKEIFLRMLISSFLIAVFLDYITAIEFVYITVGIYFVTAALMAWYAFHVRRITFSMIFPTDKKSIVTYSIFIILSGSVAVLLLDIDKFMLGLYINIDNIAYYSVAIFIATVVAVPSRAMHQIIYPITAKLMAENKHDELNALYKKSSVSLQLVGGYVLLGILVNIHSLYELLPPEYSNGIFVVFAIGASRYFDLMLGNNNSIIFNSKYYRMVLFLGLMLAVLAISLNMYFIPRYGIDGAAIATLIAITLYTMAKLWFVTVKMNLFPFSIQTVYSLAILLLGFGIFYFWNFDFHPLIDIILKSVLLTIFYITINYKLVILPEANLLLDKCIMRLRRP